MPFIVKKKKKGGRETDAPISYPVEIMPKSDNPNAKRRLLIQNKKVSILSAINLSFFLHNCMLPTFLSVYFFLTHPPPPKKIKVNEIVIP